MKQAKRTKCSACPGYVRADGTSSHLVGCPMMASRLRHLDPVQAALDAAPLVTDQMSEAEHAAVEASSEPSGEWISQAEMTAKMKARSKP